MGLKTNKCCCGCVECQVDAPTCSNCECVPKCICLRQRILYTDDDPPNEDWADSTRGRTQLACWDADIGDNGGWEATFPDNGAPCWPTVHVVIELIVVAGVCSLEATVNGVTEASLVVLDCTPHNAFAGQWEFDTDDPTNPALPAKIEIVAFNWLCGDAPCINDCCVTAPNTLTATIQGYSSDGGPCADPLTVTLTRLLSQCATYYTGTATDFPWDCNDEGPGLQSLYIKVDACNGCERLEVNDACFCGDCDGTENPGVDGCGGVLLLELTPDFGSEINTLSKCGWHVGEPWPGGAFIQSTCDPVYMEILVLVPGLTGCCDWWHVVVTE